MAAPAAPPADPRRIGARLADLTRRLVGALERADLDAAEALLLERGRALEGALAAGAGAGEAALRPVAAALRADGLRAHAALEAFAALVRQDLQDLASQGAALRAYAQSDGLPPGYVDRRD